MIPEAIKEFSKFAEPDKIAQQNQYRRMADLTRSAANAYTGLYKLGSQKHIFVKLHLTELEALASSNDRRNLVDKFQCFRCAVEGGRRNGDVMRYEAELLQAIHQLETESFLDRLGRWKWLVIVVVAIIADRIVVESLVAIVAALFS